MTDTALPPGNTGPEATQADQTALPEAGTPEPDGDEAPDSASREAARYRRKLRAAEAERDQLAARLEHLQRGEAERLAASLLADPADLWRDGANITDLINDDGHLDAEKVTELARNLVAAHPHWSKRTAPKTVKTGGMASGATSPANQIIPSWSTILRPNR